MTETVTGAAALHKRLEAIGRGTGLLAELQTRTVREAKHLVPRKTGNLGRSIVAGYLTQHNALVVARAGYALYVERGTGIYGPSRSPIVPRTKKVLAWRTGAVRLTGSSRTSGGRELAGWAFARSVKGRKATPFLVPAAEKAVSAAGVKDVVIEIWNKAG